MDKWLYFLIREMGPGMSDWSASVRMKLGSDLKTHCQMARRAHRDPCSQTPRSGGFLEVRGVRRVEDKPRPLVGSQSSSWELKQPQEDPSDSAPAGGVVGGEGLPGVKQFKYEIWGPHGLLIAKVCGGTSRLSRPWVRFPRISAQPDTIR